MRILKNVSVTSVQGWSRSEPWSVSAAGQDSRAPSSRGRYSALTDSGVKGVKCGQASSMAHLWNHGPWEMTQVASGCSPSPALDRGSSCAIFLDSFWPHDINATAVLGYIRGRRGSGRPGPSSTKGSLRPGSPAHESLLVWPAWHCGFRADGHAALSTLGLWEETGSRGQVHREASVNTCPGNGPPGLQPSGGAARNRGDQASGRVKLLLLGQLVGWGQIAHTPVSWTPE